jgi:hypothetical protein
MIETEAVEHTGAGRYERSEDRVTERNGHRPRRWRPRPAMSSHASRSSARAVSCRRSSNRVDASARPCMRW